MNKIKPSSYTDHNHEHDMLQMMRAIAIILVVTQHSVVLYFSNYFSDLLITVFVFIDVHVFMFVSGYLFEKKREEYLALGMKKFAVKKFKSLIVPYLFWAGLLFAGTYILYILSDRFGFRGAQALGFDRLSVTEICVGLLTYRYFYMQLYWFLFALFWVFMINYLFNKFSHRPEFILICFIVIALMSVILKADEYILTKICRSILTFGFGRLFQRYRLERYLLKNWIALMAGVLSFMAVFYHLTKIPMHVSEIHLRTVLKNFEIASLGVIGVAIVYIVSSFLVSMNLKFKKVLLILGDYSLAIYLLHNPWIVHASHIVLKKLSVPGWIGNAASIALGLLLPIGLYKFVIKKSKWLSRLMLGM